VDVSRIVAMRDQAWLEENLATNEALGLGQNSSRGNLDVPLTTLK
jgi:hypothetical protein